MPGRFLNTLRSRWATSDPFDLAARLLIAALFVLALLIYRDYAISNDEEVQRRYGELIYAYHVSGFTDLSVFRYQNLYLYGGLFDLISVVLGRVLPVDVYVIRHILCALIGVEGILAAWATARLIAGPRAGFIAAVALTVCGPWFGTMFNHTKDIPFAAAMMGATYFLLRAVRDLPRPRLMHLLAFGVLLGGALGQRATGLLILFYAVIAVAMHAPQPLSLRGTAHFMVQSLLLFVPAFALAYLIMIVGWPWAALHLFNPVRAIFAFAHFQYPVKTLLSGDIYLMADVPRWYVPLYIAIKMPLAILTGAALALVSTVALWHSAGARARDTAFVAFIIAFPLLCQVIAHGPGFSGMRHFLFVVPPLAVLAGVGFEWALAWLETKRRAFALAAFAAIGAWLLWPASIMLRLHPYESLYFNPLVGGLQGAQHRYDTDYWVNVMAELVVELEAMLDREGKPPARRYFVAVCGERVPFDKLAEPRGRLRYAVGTEPADFFIAPTHMHCENAIDGRVVHVVERMGVPIGVIKDRRTLIADPRNDQTKTAKK
jgi:hypothetical protein